MQAALFFFLGCFDYVMAWLAHNREVDHTILTLHMYVYMVVPWSRNNGGINSLYIYDLPSSAYLIALPQIDRIENHLPP